MSTVTFAQTAYVCQGYSYDEYDIATIGDMTFSADKTTVNIGGETYDVADIDSITFSEPHFPSVSIVYNGTTATVDIPKSMTGVTCTSGNSPHVVINNTNTNTEYLYTVSGSSADGSLTVSASYKMAVMLNGVSLTSGKGAAINIDCGKRIDIFLKEGTNNTLADYAGGDQKAAFYTKGHAEFKGGGTLNVTGNLKHAIAAKEYIIFKASLGEVNILSAVSDGIHCGRGERGNSEDNYFQMNGGRVNIKNCGSDCIDSDDYGCMRIKGGTLKLEVSQEDGTGLKCDSIYRQTGGEIEINVTGETSEGICVSYSAAFDGGRVTGSVSGSGARGIRGKKVTKLTGTVLNGGYLNFGGANISLSASGGASGTTRCLGIKSDNTMTQTAGDITITVSSTASDISATTDNWTGGTRNGKTK